MKVFRFLSLPLAFATEPTTESGATVSVASSSPSPSPTPPLRRFKYSFGSSEPLLCSCSNLSSAETVNECLASMPSSCPYWVTAKIDIPANSTLRLNGSLELIDYQPSTFLALYSFPPELDHGLEIPEDARVLFQPSGFAYNFDASKKKCTLIPGAYYTGNRLRSDGAAPLFQTGLPTPSDGKNPTLIDFNFIENRTNALAVTGEAACDDDAALGTSVGGRISSFFIAFAVSGELATEPAASDSLSFTTEGVTSAKWLTTLSVLIAALLTVVESLGIHPIRA